MFACLLAATVRCHPRQFQQVLRRKSGLDVAGWVVAETPGFSDSAQGLNARVFWVLNGIRSWEDSRVRCRACGARLSDRRSFRSLTIGYKEFCSRKCANSCQDHKLRSKQTRLSANGGRYFSEQSMQARRASCMARYGADSNMKSESGREELRRAVRRKYGVDNVFETRRCKEKSGETKQRKYGDRKFNNSAAAAETVVRKSMSDPEYWQRRIQKSRVTWRAKYGVDHPMKVAEISRKSHLNWNPDIRYDFDGFCFASIPELAFAIFCHDTGIRYVYEDTSCVMQYVDANGCMHQYFPDFHVIGFGSHTANFLVEIKGDNQFKDRNPSSGRMISLKGPAYDHVAQAKYELMVSAGVVLVTTRRYDKYLRYCRSRYGVRFHLAFRHGK